MATKNAINSDMPIEVAKGGTGIASTTAYSVICGGTTVTSPLQSVASVGTSGQVLTSNGPGALPTFQASVGGGSEAVLGSTRFVPFNDTTGVMYAPFSPGEPFISATLQYVVMPIPLSGTFSNLYYYLYTNGSTVATTATLNVNGVNTTLVATAPSGTTGTFTDLVHSVVVNAGDLIAIEMSAAVTGTTNGGFSVMFA